MRSTLPNTPPTPIRTPLSRTAALIDSGEGSFRDIETLVSMAKFYTSDMAMKVTIDAVQIHGGAGYLKGAPVERLMRDAKAEAQAKVQAKDGEAA